MHLKISLFYVTQASQNNRIQRHSPAIVLQPTVTKKTTNTHVDDVGDISALQVVEDTSFVQIGKQGHVGTHLELRGVHWLAFVDVH